MSVVANRCDEHRDAGQAGQWHSGDGAAPRGLLENLTRVHDVPSAGDTGHPREAHPLDVAHHRHPRPTRRHGRSLPHARRPPDAALTLAGALDTAQRRPRGAPHAYTRERVNLWITDREGHEAVGKLPEGVKLGLIPREGALPNTVSEAEFVVPSARDARVLEALPRMPALRVVQTLSAGVDWLLGSVPAGVTLCDAGGARDTAVAEWVVAAMLASTKALPALRDRQREHRWEWRRTRSSPAAPWW